MLRLRQGRRPMDIASVRILRLALGTSLALWVSQAVGWPMSFVAPVITMTVLALPMPAPGLKGGIGLVLVLTLSLFGGLLLLPMLLNQPAVGILLMSLALFWTFYYTAGGGSAILGTFATIGIAISTAIGTVSVDAVLAVVQGLSFCTLVGVFFIWIAHALLPDPPDTASAAAAKKVPPPAPALEEARRSALRSLLIVLPISLWFVLSSASAAYAPVMIKVASMGQQATNDATRRAGASLMMSTVIGGIAAIIGWQILSFYPSLTLYTLLVALAGLLFGRKIFEGRGMHPDGETWSYAYLTMIVILAPAVLDSIGGAAANVKFWDRMIMFGGATLYGVGAVYVFDALWPKRAPGKRAGTAVS